MSFGEIAPIDWFGTETFVASLAWCSSVSKRCTAAKLNEIPADYLCCQSAVDSALRGFTNHSQAKGKAVVGERSLEVAYLLPASARAIEAMTRAVDEGFRVFKMKIGTSPVDDELDAVRRLIEQFPDGGKLRLDANGGLDLRTASRWVDAAGDWPVEFIEQPLSADAPAELSALARDTAVSIALDESVLTADDVKRWRDREWAGVFVIKPALAGSVDAVINEIAIDPAGFVISSALETSVGASTALGLAFEAGVERALGYGVSSFFADDGLGGGVARSRLTVAELEKIRSEEVWNLL